jgi:DNA-cytosine methyltransferase
MNVLSLFDGISTGQLVLRNLGLKIDKYYASEIDKSAIQVTQKHFPETIQLGDITKINGKDLDKIDLVIGGSPCKNLTSIGNGEGLKGKDSGLFFEFIRLLEETNPTYYFLENVASMSRSSIKEINSELYQVRPDSVITWPAFVNSNHFIPQNRRRLYWTDIPHSYSFLKPELVPVKESMRSLLFDWTEVPAKYFMTQKQVDLLFKETSFNKKPEADPFHSRPLTCQAYTGRAAKDNIVTETSWPEDKTKYRKLMPIEYERLQGLPDGYTDVLKDTNRYKAVGNGWTVPVIESFFKNIKIGD